MASSPAAVRLRRHRERVRLGKIMLLIEADEIGLIEQLMAAGFLSPAHMDDRAAVTAALQRVVDLWAQGDTRYDTPFSDLPTSRVLRASGCGGPGADFPGRRGPNTRGAEILT